MTDKIILVGGGGHCRACIDVIESANAEIAGIIDKDRSAEKIFKYSIIGSDDDIGTFSNKNYSFLVTIGQLKNPALRIEVFEKIKKSGGQFATVISSTALLSKYSRIGEGTIVMHEVIINASSQIGTNCIINTRALIEHDCMIGDHTHISTAAVVNGGCKIGNRTFIGSNSTIVQGVQIGDDVVVGAGSVVLRDLLEKGTFAGIPAKKISS